MADLLRTDYKDDILNTEVNTQRKYRMVQNNDGTVSFEDVTEYEQVGDNFGAADINKTNLEVDKLNNSLGGFEFTTQNDKDGYMKDGEFHPFGNPYLRYNEDTGYIQALDINGNWQNLYQTSSLPIEWINIDNIVLANQPYVTFDVGATSYASYVNNADKYVTYSVQNCREISIS